MRLIVHLTPKASHNKIDGWSLDAEGNTVLRVKVTAVPEDGKANEALIKLLAKTLHISKSSLSLIHGTTSRVKHIEIAIEKSGAMQLTPSSLLASLRLRRSQ